MEGEQEEVNLYDYGIQLTRSFRALKLWMSLKVFGLAAFRQAVTHGLNLARIAEGKLKKMSGWEIITPAQMGIVTFRYVPQNLSPGATDTFNRELVAPIVADGFALVVSTIIKNRTVLRFCTINPRTTEEDIGQVIKKLDQYAQEQTTNWK
jgi:glutamate/tyrosine decarboxylase-like PLP-dependent enzyme